MKWFVSLFAVCLCSLALAVEDPGYDVEPVYDLDGDGQLDVDDLHMFQGILALMGDDYLDLELDWNPDGVLDGYDIVSWLGVAGKPVGDWNLDGVKDNLDTVIMAAYYDEAQPHPYRRYDCGDITCDGRVDSSDLVMVMIYQ